MSRSVTAVLLVCCLGLTAGCEGLKVRMAMVEGNKLYKAQKYDQAIEEYKKILAVDPNNFMANYLIAISNLAMYHPGSSHPKDKEYAEQSIAAFEKTLELEPPGGPSEKKEWSDKLQKYYLSLLTSAGQDDKAIVFLEKRRQQHPNDVPTLQQLATYYAKLDFGKALDAFQKVAELDPTKEHLYTVGVVCWERSYKGGMAVSDDQRVELIATGLDALQKALAKDPNYFEALSYVNLLHREKAKVCANRQDLECYNEALKTADEYMRKALEARKAQQAAQATAQS